MAQLMEADVGAACGPRGKHDPARTATRHGTQRGSVTSAGRPRSAGLGSARLLGSGAAGAAYELLSGIELLGRMAMQRMLAGVSTRRYRVALEPVVRDITVQSTSTSKSAVSRRFVAMTEHALSDLLAADLVWPEPGRAARARPGRQQGGPGDAC